MEAMVVAREDMGDSEGTAIKRPPLAPPPLD
jgi:hypothetical protein